MSRSHEPWPAPRNEAQIALHNSRVAISRAEDELAGFKDATWLHEAREALSLTNDILRGAFDAAAKQPHSEDSDAKLDEGR